MHPIQARIPERCRPHNLTSSLNISSIGVDLGGQSFCRRDGFDRHEEVYFLALPNHLGSYRCNVCVAVAKTRRLMSIAKDAGPLSELRAALATTSTDRQLSFAANAALR